MTRRVVHEECRAQQQPFGSSACKRRQICASRANSSVKPFILALILVAILVPAGAFIFSALPILGWELEMGNRWSRLARIERLTPARRPYRKLAAGAVAIVQTMGMGKSLTASRLCPPVLFLPSDGFFGLLVGRETCRIVNRGLCVAMSHGSHH